MHQLDETLQIETPENIAFGYEVAGIGSRFLAALIDTFLITILQVVANLLLLLVISRGGAGIGSVLEEGGAGWVIAVVGLISFLFLWGYYIFFEMLWNGQSPGKAVFRLRVIRSDGTPITLSESIIRNLVRLVDFLPAYYGIGVITMFVQAQSRRLGDLAANTLVVHENPQKVSLKSLASSLAPALVPNQPQSLGDGLPVNRLREADVQLAETFLARRAELGNRHEMAVRVANTLLARMGEPTDNMTHFKAEELLISIVQTYRNRGGV